jgi:uncharacterized protein (TIGR04222 family)
MVQKLQRDIGMYPARYGGDGPWPHHPESAGIHDGPQDGAVSRAASPGSFPDPYEVAYLRDGEEEVLTLALFDLFQRGKLEVIETKKWFGTERRVAAAADASLLDDLTEPEKDLMSRFGNPLSARELFGSGLTGPLRAACAAYKARLKEAGLLRVHARQWPLTTALVLAAVIGILAGAAKASLPVFLAGMAAAIATAFLLSSRMTASGRARLRQLKAEFAHLEEFPKTARLRAGDPALLMTFAVFGAPILADSPFDAFARALRRNAAGGGWEIGGDGCSGCGGCD